MKTKKHQGERQEVYLAVTERKTQLILCNTFPLFLFQLLHKDGLNVRQKGLCTSVFHWMQCNCFPSLRKRYQIIVIFFIAILLKKWYTLAERKKESELENISQKYKEWG